MQKKALICDLDNTLYDWVGYFVPSFYAMVDAVVQITRCDREKLLDDFRTVHQKYRDSEQPFALLETDTIRNFFAHSSLEDAIEALDPAFHAFNSARKRNLKLHLGVKETLEELTRAGVLLIAHTDSQIFGAADRLNRLDLFRYFSKIYCRQRSFPSHPGLGDGEAWLSQFPMEKITELSHHQIKPNPDVLLEICCTENLYVSDVAYVGDSMARDILMAKHASVFSIWAAYGARHDPAMYEALVRISHWTPDDVLREKSLAKEAATIQPDYIAANSFIEILDALDLSKLSSGLTRSIAR